jgi:hypothetical protein
MSSSVDPGKHCDRTLKQTTFPSFHDLHNSYKDECISNQKLSTSYSIVKEALLACVRRKANAVFVDRCPCLKRMAACLPVLNGNVRSMLLLPSDLERRAVKISLPQKQAGNYRRSWRPGQAPLSVRSQNTFSIKKFVHLIQVRF